MAEEGPQGRAEVARLLDRHRIRPKRSLGQHFLTDPNLVRKLVRLAEGQLGDPVVEVGTGTGTLTKGLAEAGYRVRTYEVDARLAPLLDEVLGHLSNVDLRFENALEADLPGTLENGPWTLVANLPYHVGTPLLLTLLQGAPQVDRFVVMVQREVAERLIAPPGSRTYGLPSVVAQLFAEVRPAFRVPPQVFLPPPPVESMVILVQRGATTAGAEAHRAVEIAGAAFRQRRKMLRSSLRGLVQGLEEVLDQAGLSGEARAEDLAPAQYLAIARAEERA